MKIEVFNDNFKGHPVVGERLESFLKDIKTDLSVSYMADQGENFLFKKTLLLAELVQKLWNELDELKQKQEGK